MYCDFKVPYILGEWEQSLHQNLFPVAHDNVLFVIYREISNISRILAANKFVDHPNVFGASPVGAAPTTSSFST